MIQKEIELNITTGDSEAELNNISRSMNKIADSVKDMEQSVNASVKESKKLGSATKAINKTAKKATKGFRGMGLAIKAAGVGLILKALGLVQELFLSNQKIVDGFNTAFGMLAIAFNDFFNFINDNVNVIVGHMKSMFSDPQGMVKSLGTAIYDGLIVQFESLIEMMGLLGRAMGELFSGNFTEAWQLTKDAGKEMVEVVTGVDDAYDKAKETITEVTEVITDYTINTYEAAKANVKLANAADLAAAKQQGLVELYDRQAEKLRQIRDNEFKSVDDRIKANDDLKAVLDSQEEAMLKLADLQLAQASRQYSLNKNLENEKALLEAKNNKLGVLAQIEGFRSEQDSNANALLKEKLELTQSLIDAESERTIAAAQATAELEDNEIKKINLLLEALEQEKIIEEERLKLKRDSYVQGTQAYVDAQIELDNAIADANIRKEQLNHDLNAAIKAQEEEALKNRDENRDKDLANEKELQDKKFQMQNDALSAINELVIAFANESEESQKKAFQLSKAISLAQAIVSTAQGIITQLAVPKDALTGANFIKAGIVAATGAAQVATILKTQFEGGSTGTTPSAPSGTGIESQAPAFNIVGQSGFNQIAQALGQQPPVQAYVVSGNVTTAQALDNNIIETATF